MNVFLIFFALPIATIIISIALQKILKCPVLVAAIIFAIFLIVTFIVNDLTFLIATIVYTIISFITAILVNFICRFLRSFRRERDNDDDDDCCCRRRERRNYCNCRNNTNELLTINSNCGNYENGNLLTISSNGCNGTNNELLTISSNGNNNSNGNCNNGCNNCNDSSCSCNNNRSGITARINVIPNSNTNGRSGQFTGCYRRR